MAWLRIDDRVRTHPKIVEAGPAAAWFWFCGICYCREHLTDGYIPQKMLATLAPGVTNGKVLAARLVAAGLWHQVEGGYQVHDFLDWNPSRAVVLAQRAADRERKRRGFQPDSTVESMPESGGTTGRTPDGIQTTPSRDRAIARGSGSGSGSESPSTTDVRVDPPARSVPIFSRRRLALANEGDPVPLGWEQFREIQALAAPRYGGDPDAAYVPVLAWVRRIGDELRRTGTPKGAVSNPWQFWRERAEAEFCVERPAVARPACRRGHEPPCTDEAECSRRYIDALKAEKAQQDAQRSAVQ